jgi:hypothetical protein
VSTELHTSYSMLTREEERGIGKSAKLCTFYTKGELGA